MDLNVFVEREIYKTPAGNYKSSGKNFKKMPLTILNKFRAMVWLDWEICFSELVYVL